MCFNLQASRVGSPHPFFKQVPPKSGSSKRKTHPIHEKNLPFAPFRLCDGAECQHCAEKQHLPLALNQLCSVVSLTDQVDRVLQVNGVYN